jgi:hypothetical protein
VIERVVIPEILDSLPPEDAEALRCRRDLRRINFLMGNERWVMGAVAKFPEMVGRGITEIGAGDGLLCGKLARLFPEAVVTGYDLAPRPGDLTEKVEWCRGDLLEMPPPISGGVLVANLGRWLGHAEVLIFNEPDRAHLPHFLAGLLHPWINRVTRHDMHVSITAGFTVGEIASSLGLSASLWQIKETSTWRGARRVVASRRR